jgi:hypothetical protein
MMNNRKFLALAVKCPEGFYEEVINRVTIMGLIMGIVGLVLGYLIGVLI